MVMVCGQRFNREIKRNLQMQARHGIEVVSAESIGFLQNLFRGGKKMTMRRSPRGWERGVATGHVTTVDPRSRPYQ